jgi:hypothetical protein
MIIVLAILDAYFFKVTFCDKIKVQKNILRFLKNALPLPGWSAFPLAPGRGIRAMNPENVAEASQPEKGVEAGLPSG